MEPFNTVLVTECRNLPSFSGAMSAIELVDDCLESDFGMNFLMLFVEVPPLNLLKFSSNLDLYYSSTRESILPLGSAKLSCGFASSCRAAAPAEGFSW